MRLPKDSPSLRAYLEYTQDEYPIHPAITGAERQKLEALRAAGQHKHASEQAHSVYGPGVFTWFMKQSGEINHALPISVFYPVPFRQAGCISDRHAKETRARYFKDNTVGVHLWGRRFRWWVAGRGVRRHSILDRQLRRLGMDASLAPIPTHRSPYPQRISFPADLPKQQTPTEDIARSAGAATTEVREFGAFIRLAERVLRQLKAEKRYGIDQPVSVDAPRRIDGFPDDAGKVFALARLLQDYSKKAGGLPNLNHPTTYSEKRAITVLFGSQQERPAVAVEQLVEGQAPTRFRVLVLGGQIALIEYISKTKSQTTTLRYDRNLKLLGDAEPGKPTTRPRNIMKAVETVQGIATGLECTQIEVYVRGKNVLISDITIAPDYVGNDKLPSTIDQYLGQVWSGSSLFPNPATAV